MKSWGELEIVRRWGKWEIVRRQVALCGRVTDQKGKPAAGVLVSLVEEPPGTRPRAGRRRARSTALSTHSRVDGIYFFLDLPAADYTVFAESAALLKPEQKKARVSLDTGGNILRTVADIVLSSD